MQNVALDMLEADELTALAHLDLEAERFDQALGKLKRAVALGAPGESRAMLGRLYARLGLFERAKDMLGKYLEAHPDSLASRMHYAMVNLDMGEPDAALQTLEQLLANEPAHPPALFHKALVLARKGQKPQALSTIDVLLKSASPDNLFYGRGNELKAELERAQGAFTAAPGSAKIQGKQIN